MVVLLIPAYQPGPALVSLVQSCQRLGLSRVVVVNDGSSDACRPVWQALSLLGVTVLSHPQNRGKGAALKTGLAHVCAHIPQATGIVTADADGQHRPEDILRVAQGLQHHRVVLGSRDLTLAQVPWRSRVGNRLSSVLFRLLTGRACADTQTGLRGFESSLFSRLLACEGERYDYEMNVLIHLADRRIPWHVEKIATVYFNNNAASHFRPVRDSLRIYRRPLRFAASSLCGAGVDLVLFGLLTLLPTGIFTIFLATVLARCVSGAVNFTLNKLWSFSSTGNTRKELGRYGSLFLVQMLASYVLVQLLSFLPLPAVLWKIPVDVGLFFISYAVQRRWVYGQKGRTR